MPIQLALSLPNPLAARQSLFMSTEGAPYTTSRAVAERFGKNHKDVLRAIENLLGVMPDPAFAERNFALSMYQIRGGKNTVRNAPEYRLTHDGFAFLAMRFTGSEAMAWQIAFLQAFNAMEAELQARTARFATALDQVRPNLRPTVEDAEAGLPRTTTAMRLGKSAGAVSYHRSQARRFGLLPSGARCAA